MNRIAKLTIIGKINELKEENAKFEKEHTYTNSAIDRSIQMMYELLAEIDYAECRKEILDGTSDETSEQGS